MIVEAVTQDFLAVTKQAKSFVVRIQYVAYLNIYKSRFVNSKFPAQVE